jgi:hypothetical protein
LDTDVFRSRNVSEICSLTRKQSDKHDKGGKCTITNKSVTAFRSSPATPPSKPKTGAGRIGDRDLAPSSLAASAADSAGSKKCAVPRARPRPRPLRRARGRVASGRCSRTTLAPPRAPCGDAARRHATAARGEISRGRAIGRTHLRKSRYARGRLLLRPWPVDTARDGEEGRQEGEGPARSERR